MTRSQNLAKLNKDNTFDVAILGGGINGACLYDTLCRQGYRVLLVDKGDFASGTSQASGMMIWGGFLYLGNFDLYSVATLSSDRNSMMKDMKAWIAPRKLRFLPSSGSGRPSWFVHLALWFYWLMGLCKTSAPSVEKNFPEAGMIKPELVRESLCYEEAFLEDSDSRFVFRWIAPHQGSGQLPLNYCDVGGNFDNASRRWELELKDRLSGEACSVTAAMIVNCAGVWTDEVNASFGISMPFRHVLSKGVYLGFRKDPRNQSSLVFELGEQGDVITLVPWGPLSMWGPTETAVNDLSQGFAPGPKDVAFLLEHYNRRFCESLGRKDIVSIRCGIRPLCVDKDFQADCYPLDLSRRQEVVMDSEKPWLSCYGGKLTGCTRMAAKAAQRVGQVIPATSQSGRARDDWEAGIERVLFPGLEKPVPSASWCANNELCVTLEDYLRRRTNIAQWIERMGLGQDDCHAPMLREMALQISGGDEAAAESMYQSYHNMVAETFDPLLAGTL